MSATPDMQQQLGQAIEHHRAGRFDQAAELYRKVLADHPTEPTALVNLSQAYRSLGQHAQALETCLRARDVAPQSPDVWNNLGTALGDAGRIDDAIAAFRRAVELQPGYLKAFLNLTSALLRAGRSEEAEAALHRAAELDPLRAMTWSDLGHLAARRNAYGIAIERYRRALAIDANFTIAHNNLGNALFATGQTADAEASFRRAIELDPRYAEAHANRARLLSADGRVDEAIASAQTATTLRPDLAAAHVTLAGALQQQGAMEEADAALADALKQGFSNPQLLAAAESTRLMLMLYTSSRSPQEIFEAHARWGARYADPLIDPTPHANDRDPDRQLRVGYFSADFRAHPVAQFLEPLLMAHDRQQVEIVAYSGVSKADAVTARLRARFDAWHDVASLSDDALAAKIRSDRIDILMDCSGHTAGNRLLTFARKPAPVQVAYLGYSNTRGVRAIDYRFTDALAEPEGTSDALSTERLVRLPAPYHAYLPPAGASDVAERPPDAPLTFGSFNNVMKLGDETVALWSRALRALPRATMLIKSAGLDQPGARMRLVERFAQHGVTADRLRIVGADASFADHLARYAQVDLVLDPFPFHGTTMTCEALWMGVPVVCLVGQTHVARVDLSLLTSVGLPQLAASDADAFVHAVTELARDHTALAQLRRELRERMKQSPLTDGVRLARQVESAYRAMWQTYCGKMPQ